jgi:hypothetical protein
MPKSDTRFFRLSFHYSMSKGDSDTILLKSEVRSRYYTTLPRHIIINCNIKKSFELY